MNWLFGKTSSCHFFHGNFFFKQRSFLERSFQWEKSWSDKEKSTNFRVKARKNVATKCETLFTEIVLFTHQYLPMHAYVLQSVLL